MDCQDENGAFASSVSNSESLSAAGAGFIGRERTEVSINDGVTTTTSEREPAEFTDLVARLPVLLAKPLVLAKLIVAPTLLR